MFECVWVVVSTFEFHNQIVCFSELFLLLFDWLRFCAVTFLYLRNVSADNAILVVCSSEVNPMMESQEACFPE